MKMRLRALTIVVPLLAAGIPFVLSPSATAIPNPVATDEATYQALGRVFPDPHGCLAFGAPDLDGNGVKDTPPGVSPWAKGRACADQFLSYQEVIDGARFLQARFPEFLKVIRLDQAYDNPNYQSAGLPRNVLTDDGKVKFLGRDRRPLYLLKVTDSTSPVPERERKHFAYSLSIHGIERAGIEGGIRAMEDLVTWAACELPKYSASTPATPACSAEGPFPKKIVETPSTYEVPTAGEVVDNAVVYFVLPNPDGWGRGQVAPVEVEDGTANTNYVPGVFFQRYNGNGVDVNRDWPTKGYTYKPYSPGSEPETMAFGQVLRGIKASTDDNRFDGGIDLHGMGTAYAFSYTLIGAAQKDFERNELTVETAIRTWEDQTRRMNWSNYVADKNANGQNDTGETCINDQGFVVFGSGTRPRTPACVADQWGTVIDTIGYQITGGIGDWMESPIGLDAIGIDNEMWASHIIPNTIYEPGLEQTHIDGNKGLIMSQLAALLTSDDITYQPAGKIGYIYNPKRLVVEEDARIPNPGLPAQNDIDTIVPCQSAAAQNLEGACGLASWNPTEFALEFDVKGPEEGIWNGGITVQITKPNATGIGDGNFFQMHLQHLNEGQWQTIASDFNQSFLYAQAGAIITANDPTPGRYRVLLGAANTYPMRVRVNFNPVTAEGSPGQAAIDASSMDFFDELNQYVPEGSEIEAIEVDKVKEKKLEDFDTVVVVNDLGNRAFLTDLTNGLGFSPSEADKYFEGLKGFAQDGGNLVLTDGAVRAAAEIGLVPAGDIRAVTAGSETDASNYNFQIAAGNITYTNPAKYPLAAGVNKPGAAEQQPGRRQAVEPSPLGYSPDYGFDADPRITQYGVNKAAWTAACGLADCVTSATSPNGTIVNLGEAAFGEGRVRIAGVLLPNPVYAPDDTNDNRFGLADYSLTYTGWEVFKNVVNFNRA